MERFARSERGQSQHLLGAKHVRGAERWISVGIGEIDECRCDRPRRPPSPERRTAPQSGRGKGVTGRQSQRPVGLRTDPPRAHSQQALDASARTPRPTSCHARGSGRASVRRINSRTMNAPRYPVPPVTNICRGGHGARGTRGSIAGSSTASASRSGGPSGEATATAPRPCAASTIFARLATVVVSNDERSVVIRTNAIDADEALPDAQLALAIA